MSAETRGFPSGDMRASDADRDLAIAELSEHFQTGRLTQEEFDDRSSRALRARTGRELTELFTDLPGRDGTGRPGGPVGQDGSQGPLASSGSPWPGSAWAGPAAQPGRGPLGRSAARRRPVPFVIVGVLAVIAVASLLGSVVNVGVIHIGIGHGGFGWLIPILIVALVVRRAARRR
jgi:hypothetical protein